MKGGSVFNKSEPVKGSSGIQSESITDNVSKTCQKLKSNKIGPVYATSFGQEKEKKLISENEISDEGDSSWDDLSPGNLVIDLDATEKQSVFGVTKGGKLLPSTNLLGSYFGRETGNKAVNSCAIMNENKIALAVPKRLNKAENSKNLKESSDLAEPLPKMKIKRNKMPTRQSGAKHEVVNLGKFLPKDDMRSQEDIFPKSSDEQECISSSAADTVLNCLPSTSKSDSGSIYTNSVEEVSLSSLKLEGLDDVDCTNAREGDVICPVAKPDSFHRAKSKSFIVSDQEPPVKRQRTNSVRLILFCSFLSKNVVLLLSFEGYFMLSLA